jgi:hypothetical protein
MSKELGSPRGHGAAERGQTEAARATSVSSPTQMPFAGRFGRMFPGLREAAFFDRDLVSLAAAMSAEDEGEATGEEELDSEENLGLPAGYTYFGQFVDHDITLDAVSLSMQQEDLSAVDNFRTPALDLDSLYGRGPADQPYLYQQERLFWLGDTELTAGPGGKPLAHDLARFQGRALIGDKRNDENIIVSQLHGLFLQLHNRLAADNPDWDFERVRQATRWHYQWLVLFDYLPRIVGRELVASILPHTTAGGTPASCPPQLRFYRWDKYPFMPVEFAGAAYRFGHSMVRPIYRLNGSDELGDAGRLAIFNPPVNGEGLNGFRPIPPQLGIDWDLYFETRGRRLADNALGKGRIQPAYKIDTSLVFPLSRLPEFSDAQGNPQPATATNMLALRNLKRGMMLMLPSGQAVARQMGLTPLRDDELLVGKADAEHFDQADPDQRVPSITDHGRSSMQDSAPLWFYVLAEARHQWKQDASAALAAAGDCSPQQREALINGTPTRLGPVGGRIVAETLIGLALGDPHSLLNAGQGFTPAFGGGSRSVFDRFTLGDLSSAIQG